MKRRIVVQRLIGASLIFAGAATIIYFLWGLYSARMLMVSVFGENPDVGLVGFDLFIWFGLGAILLGMGVALVLTTLSGRKV